MVTVGDRVKAGETVELAIPDSSGSDTQITVQGLDWYQDIGDLSQLEVSADNATLSVQSKRLQSLKLGDEVASNVTSNVKGLTMGANPSMMVVDARNLTSLTGTVDLTGLPRLRQALFGGTNVRSLGVASGSKIEHLQFGDGTTSLTLQNLKFLETLELNDSSKIEFFRVEHCSGFNSFELLKTAYNLDSQALKDIRIIGFVYDGDSTDADMLANFANDLDKNGNEHAYNGINSEGAPMPDAHPVIEGTLNIAGSIYEDSAEAIRANYPNLTLIVEGGYYIRFADPVVQEICATNWGDGVGITPEQAAAIKNFNNKLQSNTAIVTFQEAKYFSGLTTLNGAFKSSSIQTLILDFEGNNANAIDIAAICQSCTSLVRVVIKNAKIRFGTSAGWRSDAFNGCTQLRTVVLENCDTSGSTSLAYALNDTEMLESLDWMEGNDWSNVINLSMFAYGYGGEILKIGGTFSNKLTIINQCVKGATSRHIDLSNLVWDNVTDCGQWFTVDNKNCVSINVGNGMGKAMTSIPLPGLYGTQTLLRIDGYFDATKATSHSPIYGMSTCRKFEIRHLGTQSALTSARLDIYPVWGINSAEVPDAEESLIDSMHYLHDRVASGFETCTLILSAATKNVLNKYPDLVAEIVSKGYTIA